MKNDNAGETSRRRKWVLLLFLAAMVAGSVASLKSRLIFRIPQSIFRKASHVTQSKGLVKCSLACNVNEKHNLRLKLAIDCKGSDQRMDLMRNLPRFKHELLMKFGSPEMEAAIMNRDFKSLKTQFVKILNQLLKRPVKKIYIENYFYD